MCLSDLRKVFILTVALLLPVEVWAQKPVEVTIPGEATVSGEAVALGDIATIHANSDSDVDKLAGLMISQFPSNQTEMQVPSSYLARRIAEAMPELIDFHLDAPEQILLHLKRETSAAAKADATGITKKELAELINSKARSSGLVPDWVETQVEIVSGMENLKGLSIKDVAVEPAGTSRWKGNLSFKVIQGQSVKWVSAKVRWFGQVWAAARDIAGSSQANPADFETARLELTSLREDPIGANENIETLLANARMRRQLRAHDALVKGAVERKPDARAGQDLKVVFVSASGIRVTADGSLLGAGAVGDEVRARLKSSKKIVVGQLVKPGLVEVSL
jgi:flagella basal body P-ring formation protein FlgA